MESCRVCISLLSEGLDLCVRARGMDAIDRRNACLDASVDGKEWERHGRFDEHVRRHNIKYADRPLATRSATVHVWMQDQYDKDLAEWERKARHHLGQGCQTVVVPFTLPSPGSPT